MSDLGNAKRRADGELDGDKMGTRKFLKMTCSGLEKDADCAPEGSAGGNGDNEDSVGTNLEGEDNARDGDDSTRKVELRAGVSSALMEAQVAPATDPNTITKNAVAAAAVEIDMYTAVSTVTAATPSAGPANDPCCFENLSPKLRTLISDEKDPLVDSECRPPTPGSAISASIEKDVESHYPYDHSTLVLELNTAGFNHLGESFLTRTLDDHRADMAPHIRSLTCRPHANEVIISVANDGLDPFILSYTLVLNHTDSKSPCRPNHEPFRLALGHEYLGYGATHEDLHNDEHHSRLLSCFQILEMAVYSLIFDVFTPTLSQASSGYKFIKAMGATFPSRLSPTAHLAILDFEPGMLSRYMFDLWMSEAECHEFLCLIYRFQVSRQNADGEESREEFWLDDGTRLGGEDRDNVMAWRAVLETSQRYDLSSDVRGILENAVRSTHTDDIFHCPFKSYIGSGKTVPREKVIWVAERWQKFCTKLSPDTSDPERLSKKKVEAFLVEHNVEAHRADAERTG